MYQLADTVRPGVLWPCKVGCIKHLVLLTMCLHVPEVSVCLKPTSSPALQRIWVPRSEQHLHFLVCSLPGTLFFLFSTRMITHDRSKYVVALYLDLKLTVCLQICFFFVSVSDYISLSIFIYWFLYTWNNYGSNWCCWCILLLIVQLNWSGATYILWFLHHVK
jgi:hypothetical protein